MVGDEYSTEPNRTRYWPMSPDGLYERVQKYTGTTAFPELGELVPTVLAQDPAMQHWFVDRTRATYNAGKGGQ